MTQTAGDYLFRCIEDALHEAGGSKSKAMQAVIERSAHDPDLLRVLTQAHLKGIVAYHVDRVADAVKEDAKNERVKNQRTHNEYTKNASSFTGRTRAHATTESKPEIRATAFGAALLSAASHNAGEQFGFENQTASSPVRTSVSQTHIDTLRHIAALSKIHKKR